VPKLPETRAYRRPPLRGGRGQANRQKRNALQSSRVVFLAIRQPAWSAGGAGRPAMRAQLCGLCGRAL